MTTDFDPRDHDLDPRTTLARVSEGGECRRTSPGHLVHFIQARLLNTKPERWQDAVVVEADPNGAVHGRLLDGDAPWWGVHHRSLAEDLPPGSPVQVALGSSALFLGPGRVRSVRFSTDGPPAPLEPCRGLRPIVTRDADGTERVVGYTADGSAD